MNLPSHGASPKKWTSSTTRKAAARPPIEPLHRLVRADPAEQRRAPGRGPDEQAADVVGDGAEGEHDHGADAVGEGEDEGGEGAEEADVDDAEHGDGGVRQRARSRCRRRPGTTPGW